MSANANARMITAAPRIPRMSHVSFLLAVYPLKLCGHKDVGCATVATAAARATAAEPGACRGRIGAVLDFLFRWLVNAILCNDIFCAPNNHADLQMRDQRLKWDAGYV